MDGQVRNLWCKIAHSQCDQIGPYLKCGKFSSLKNVRVYLSIWNFCDFFLGHSWKNWATFNSNIWSHSTLWANTMWCECQITYDEVKISQVRCTLIMYKNHASKLCLVGGLFIKPFRYLRNFLCVLKRDTDVVCLVSGLLLLL